MVPNRLFNERISWLLFPLYLRTENHGVTATSLLWPFVRLVSGDGNSGFALWPLFGWRSKQGIYEREFYLWPLIYRDASRLNEPVPDESYGILPFYARESTATVKSETYLWPFFGYLDRTAPDHYHESRYFWPLWVQGRGDERYRNRWAPFYTHSNIKGLDKTWVLWPAFRREQWTDGGLIQTKTQFLYLIYWSLEQRSATNPRLAAAHKTHLWPIWSSWDNGAGRRQVQVLSPFEVLFPGNDNTRLLWTPLFALYRYDRRSADDYRHSLLFDLVTWRRTAARREFHLGPLLSVKSAEGARRIVLGNGLFGFQRPAGDAPWQTFWFDFSRETDNSPPPTR
jgi:hypothetical protein